MKAVAVASILGSMTILSPVELGARERVGHRPDARLEGVEALDRRILADGGAARNRLLTLTRTAAYRRFVARSKGRAVRIRVAEPVNGGDRDLHVIEAASSGGDRLVLIAQATAEPAGGSGRGAAALALPLIAYYRCSDGAEFLSLRDGRSPVHGSRLSAWLDARLQDGVLVVAAYSDDGSLRRVERVVAFDAAGEVGRPVGRLDAAIGGPMESNLEFETDGSALLALLRRDRLLDPPGSGVSVASLEARLATGRRASGPFALSR